MNPALHQYIAHLALEHQWLSAGEICEILLTIGQRCLPPNNAPLDTWLNEGWLSATQLDQILESLEHNPELSPLISSQDRQKIKVEYEFIKANSQHNHVNGSPTAVTDDSQTLHGSDSSPQEFYSPNQTLLSSPAITPDDLLKVATPPDNTSVSSTFLGIPHPTFSPKESLADESEATLNINIPIDALSDINSVDEESHADPTLIRVMEAFSATTEEKHEFQRTATTVYHSPRQTDYVPPKQRYVLGELLGSGGGGRVVRAYDRVLGRSLAIKIMWPDAQKNPQNVARFLAEAQATGQIEHPNIVPVYDFGVLDSGEIFYTMREIRRHSLREVLQGLSQNDPHYTEEYTLIRLLTIFKQVCLAINYAHVRGVIHRDLKPSNIMLGDYGEVLVTDWGLARVLDRSVQTNLSAQGDEKIEEGHTLGTPAYMPPEQARGELNDVDETSDIYSLGAILYEILTLKPAFEGETPIEIMWKVVDSDFLPPNQVVSSKRSIPDELERICLKAMARYQEERFPNAKALHDSIENWMEGIQTQEASNKVHDGQQATLLYLQYTQDIRDLDNKVRRIAENLEDWEPIERKQTLWQLEDARDKTHAACARAFGQAVSSFTQALAYQGDNDDARQGLADLYWRRFQQAEASSNVSDTIYFKNLVQQYDNGKYSRLIEGQVNLSLLATPSDCRVTLCRFEEKDRRLQEVPYRTYSGTPLKINDVSIGSYLFRIDHPNHPSVVYPIYLERGNDADIHVELPDYEDIEEGFIFVPGSECIIGGDPNAVEASSLQRVYIPSFFCAILPVTFGQYLEWINLLHQTDPDQAIQRAPQTRGSEGLLIQFNETTQQWEPDDILIEGPARSLYPLGAGHEYNLPVVGIRAEDAQAYCQWRSTRDGRPYRLPTEHELEKCGRGVDGRYFPWGSRFDATFCKMNTSRREPSQLEPVGSFDHDVSPYGIKDLAGGVREWCLSDNPNSIETPTKGGAWSLDERACRMASRFLALSNGQVGTIGFRLVYSLDYTPSPYNL